MREVLRDLLSVLPICVMLAAILLLVSCKYPISWVWILSPIWEMIALVIIGFICALITILIEAIRDYVKSRKEE